MNRAVIVGVALVCSINAYAAVYECEVTRKLDSERVYTKSDIENESTVER